MPRRILSLLWTGVGLLFCIAITVVFGLIPFFLGVFAQALSPRRIPAYVLGPLAGACFFGFYYLTGWRSFTVGDGNYVWLSVLLSLIFFMAFFASGAAVLRELLPARFAVASEPPSSP